MMKKRYIYWLMFVFGIQYHTTAQNYFQAIIRDSSSKEPLAGASVRESGTNNKTQSDMLGNIKLKVSNTGFVTFIIQYVGYESKNIIVAIPQKDNSHEILLFSGSHELEQVTVTSVRTNSRIENIPTRVEVLGLDDMNEENGIKPGNIMSLLGDIAGIQMQQVSATSGNTFARIQGLNGRYTQLLKDGMPLYGGMSGSFGILQIPPLDLKQIEIIKGSSSTLYGGDAIGGIINLVSKDPGKKQELSFTVNQTSLLETNINGYTAKKYKKFGYTFFAGQTIQQQRDINKDGLSDVPQTSTTVIHPKLVFYLTPHSVLTLNYTGTFENRLGGDMRYFSSGAPDSLYHVRYHIQRNSTDAKWKTDLSKTSTLTVKASSSMLSQDLGTKYYTFNGTQLIYYSEVSYFHQYKKMNWVAGVNLNGDHFENKSSQLASVSNYNYHTIGAFVQNTYNPIKKMVIETGLRGDYHSKYGFFPLPRLSLMYKFNYHLTARLNGGFGYKVPVVMTYINPETDLQALYNNNSLKTEYSKGLNADVNYHKAFSRKLDITLNQAFFFTNLSQPVYDSSSVAGHISLSNAPSALRTMGLQTYGRIHYHDVEFYLGYVFTDVKKLYDAYHPLLPVTPRHNLSTTIIYEVEGKWRFGVESSWIAGQLDQDYQPVKNYFLMAAMIQYNIGKFSFVLNGENLLDFRQNKKLQIYDGTLSNPVFHKLWAPIDGRVINLSVKWKL